MFSIWETFVGLAVVIASYLKGLRKSWFLRHGSVVKNVHVFLALDGISVLIIQMY